MSLWQTSQWQNMLQKSFQVEEYFEIDGIFIEKRKIFWNICGLFIIGIEKKIDISTFEKIKKLCQKEKTVFIQIESVLYTEKFSLQEYLGIGYYKKFIPSMTVLIDVRQSEDEILLCMKPKGRYNIRLAQKKGICVQKVEKNEKNIKQFYILMLQTWKRDRFAGNTFEYYKIFLQLLKDSELFLAYYEQKVIAGGIFVFQKDVSLYYYGASIDEKKYRNMMAPYLLQWEAIRYAKGIGCQYYDFLGVAGKDDIYSPLRGVTDFKMKFHPYRWKVSESFLWKNKNILYIVLLFLKKGKEIFRKITKK